MTADEYEKLPAADRARFVQCPQCGEILSLEEVLFHVAYKQRRHSAFGMQKNLNSPST
jgi:hypothetical protein